MDKEGDKSIFLKSVEIHKWAKLWRIPRFLIYFLGFISVFWYFWSLIGLIIGILYFIFLKDIAWRRNGIVLAFLISFVTIFIFFYKAYPPLNLAIWFGIGFILLYPLLLLIFKVSKKKLALTGRVKSWYSQVIKGLGPKLLKSIKILAIIVPLVSWSLVSIDLGVIFDNSPRLLWVHVSSKVKTGEPFKITVEAWDPFERLSATYNGKVEFSIESYNLSNYNLITNPQVSLPQAYTFTGQMFGTDIAYEIKDGKDNGIRVFEMSIITPGIHYILVKDSLTKNTYYSNPIIVDNSIFSDQLIVWGDLHSHSELSDGTGTPEHSYYYARYIACVDFCALTDHGEIMLFSPGSLDILEASTNAAYEPNEFVTFHGIEWTNVPTGHYVCVFSGNQLLKSPVLSYLTVPTTQALWNTLDEFTLETGSRALALPHHTTKKSYIQDWTYINPKYVKIAEVTSVHGESLFEPRHDLSYRGAIDEPPEYVHGSSIVDAFTMGKRMTMYAASDEHDGHPGHSLSHTRAYIGHQRPFSLWHTRNEHPYPGGLTAVFVDNLTREGVFSGIENQKIFANSDHGRPLLFFTINNVGVGEGSTLIVNNRTSARSINIFLAQDGAPVALKSRSASVTPNWVPNWNAYIEIIKNGKRWRTVDVFFPINNITIIDTEPIVGASYESYCIEINGESYINGYSDNPVDPSTLNTGGSDYYLIRVVGDNGRTSYAGPIWVEF